MVGQQFSDFKEDNAKFLAKAYCEVVKDVFVKATEEEFRGADLTLWKDKELSLVHIRFIGKQDRLFGRWMNGI